MSKGSSQRMLIVDWDSTLRIWKRRPEQDGFFELLEPFSETWPPSGSMRSGSAWGRTRSGLPTVGGASSSTRGRLLSTPVASDGGTDRGSSAGWGLRDETRRLLPTPRTSDTNGAGTHGDGGMDLRTAVSLLPTPAARDWKSGESNLIGTNSRPLNEVVVNLLPTPRATRGGSATETMYELGAERTDESRPQGEVLLPTPTASNPNDGESLESWEARRQRNLAKKINRKKDNPNVNPGWTLSDVVYDGQLLPTPTASDGERTSSTYGRGNPTLTGAITNPRSDGGKQSSDGVPPGPLTLWDA